MTGNATLKNLEEQADMSQGFGIESADTKNSPPTVSKSTQAPDIGCIQKA